MITEMEILFKDVNVIGRVFVPSGKWEAFKKFASKYQLYLYVALETETGRHVCFMKMDDVDGIRRYMDDHDFVSFNEIEEIAIDLSARSGNDRARQFKHMEDKLYRSKHKPFILSRCTWNGRIPMMKDAEIRGAFMGMSNQLIDTELALEISNEDDPQRMADLMEKFNYELAVAEMRVMNDMNGGVNHFKAVVVDGDEQNGSVYACQKQFAKIAKTQQGSADKAIKRLERMLIKKGYIQSIGAIFGD